MSRSPQSIVSPVADPETWKFTVTCVPVAAGFGLTVLTVTVGGGVTVIAWVSEFLEPLLSVAFTVIVY